MIIKDTDTFWRRSGTDCPVRPSASLPSLTPSGQLMPATPGVGQTPVCLGTVFSPTFPPPNLPTSQPLPLSASECLRYVPNRSAEALPLALLLQPSPLVANPAQNHSCRHGKDQPSPTILSAFISAKSRPSHGWQLGIVLRLLHAVLGRLIRALAGGFVPARAAAAPLPLARTQDPHSSCGRRSAVECRPWQLPLALLPFLYILLNADMASLRGL